MVTSTTVCVCERESECVCTVDREISSLINFRRYPSTTKIKNTKNFQHRIIRTKLHFQYAEATKIKQRENFNRRIFLRAKSSDLHKKFALNFVYDCNVSWIK